MSRGRVLIRTLPRRTFSSSGSSSITGMICLRKLAGQDVVEIFQGARLALLVSPRSSVQRAATMSFHG